MSKTDDEQLDAENGGESFTYERPVLVYVGNVKTMLAGGSGQVDDNLGGLAQN